MIGSDVSFPDTTVKRQCLPFSSHVPGSVTLETTCWVMATLDGKYLHPRVIRSRRGQVMHIRCYKSKRSFFTVLNY